MLRFLYLRPPAPQSSRNEQNVTWRRNPTPNLPNCSFSLESGPDSANKTWGFPREGFQLLCSNNFNAFETWFSIPIADRLSSGATTSPPRSANPNVQGSTRANSRVQALAHPALMALTVPANHWPSSVFPERNSARCPLTWHLPWYLVPSAAQLVGALSPKSSWAPQISTRGRGSRRDKLSDTHWRWKCYQEINV